MLKKALLFSCGKKSFDKTSINITWSKHFIYATLYVSDSIIG